MATVSCLSETSSRFQSAESFNPMNLSRKAPLTLVKGRPVDSPIVLARGVSFTGKSVVEYAFR